MSTFYQYVLKHPKTNDKVIQYGTAGFRARSEILDSVFFRMGILATLRSRVKQAAIGVMITASHNPEEDNGVKLIDPHGEMLESSWEEIATKVANVNDEDLEEAIKALEKEQIITAKTKAMVYVARDTRPSSIPFTNSVIDGVVAVNGNYKNFDLLTTPQLHYIILSENSGKVYGDPSEVGYYEKISKAFLNLNGSNNTERSIGNYIPSVTFDGANGVGAIKIKQMVKYIGNTLNIVVRNDGDGKLNYNCGADYVKVNQKPPLKLEPGERYASVDGDADRIVYYYADQSGIFHLLDGDKIAVLIAVHLRDALSQAKLDNLELCIVQTAYANGSSTSYITDVLKVPVSCVPTGVKYLHHRAQQSDIGVYFEANGHGTVVFSDKVRDAIKRAPDAEAANKLLNLMDLINQTVGDAISDCLLVETILRHRGMSVADWDKLYTDLPNRLLKVNVKDRNAIVTGDAERKCLKPEGLQNAIDALVQKYGPKSRSFVRPSGTEDVVRVYAEAETQSKADALGEEVAKAVSNLAG